MAQNLDKRQAEKRALKKLREKGLYTPKDARAAPTKYGRSMIRKYRDVLDGRATVITIPKSKRSKGWKAARDSADPSLGVYAHRNKLVVPKNERERISWSPKDKTYRVSFWSTDKTTRYVREPVKRKISNPSQLKLREGQRISIPFNRPGRGIEWMNLTEQEFKEAWAEYHDRGRYKTMGEHLHISWVVQPDKKRRAKI